MTGQNDFFLIIIGIFEVSSEHFQSKKLVNKLVQQIHVSSLLYNIE